MDTPSIDTVEAAYAAARNAFGHLVIERTRGHDVSDLERRYAAARRAVEAALLAAPPDATTDPRIASMRGTLGWFGEFEVIEGWEPPAVAPGEPADIAALRRETMDAYGAASHAIRVDGELLHRLAAYDRLATEPDPAVRRTVFEAMAPLWQAIDGDGGPASPYRRLLASSAARWAREGSPIERTAAALGQASGTMEPMLWGLLDAWRSVVGSERLEPWDYRYAIGAQERQLGPLLSADRLLPVNDAHLRSLGADPAALGIHYDVLPRDGRPQSPFAFTLADEVPAFDETGIWRPTVPWIFATFTTGGLGSLGELLHESGHGLHYAAIRQRPAFFEPRVEDGGFVEGIGELLGWDVDEPAFQERHLGASVDRRASRLARYGSIMLDVCWTLFELELHRRPDRVPNEVWSEITERGLGIAPHPEWSWWAVRAQLIDAPGYLSNYVFAGLVAAALRARIREVRGDWLVDGGDPGWYPFVADALLRDGAARPASEILTAFLGQPVSTDAAMADLTAAS